MFFALLHLIGLPAVIIAALVNGLPSVAFVDGVVFVALFAVEAMLWPVRVHLSRPFLRPVPEYQAE